MTRVLVVTNMYPPHHYGGYELLCSDVVRRWRDRGHAVEVATSTHRVRGVQDRNEPDVHRVLRFYWEDHELLTPPIGTRLRWEVANRRALGALLDAFNPDVVSVWNFGAMSYALLAQVASRDIPMALVVGDNWLCWGPDYDTWTRMFAGTWWREAAGAAVHRVTGVHTRYPDLGRDAVALYGSSWLRDRVHESSRFRFVREAVVPMGFDTETFPVTTPANEPWRGQLLFVGRIDERKGVLAAIRALALLPPPARLRIDGRHGDDAEVARAKALVRELGVEDRVTFTQVDRAELRALYMSADAVLFPSEWGEPFGIVPLEAMACGIPVIATGTGGSADFLRHDENCLIVPPADPPSLAAAVRRLESDDGLRRRLAEGGTRTARAHSVEATATALESWHLAAATRFADGEPATARTPT
jgi:glycosyltransferase involved in cell wall biosynthesis